MPVKPALTAEEWKQGFAWIGPHMVLAERTATERNVGGFDIRLNAGGGNPDRAVASFTPEQAHAIAALALAYQPFGFTREDVALLRSVADAFSPYTHAENRKLNELAARIAALLPEKK